MFFSFIIWSVILLGGIIGLSAFIATAGWIIDAI